MSGSRPLTGGRAWRVSADHAPTSSPRLSPDGTQVAWTSTRENATEVFTAPVDGGTTRRLTWWGARTVVLGWLSGDELLVATAAGEHSARLTVAVALPVAGGPARPLPWGRVGAAAVEPGGPGIVTSTPTMSEPAWRKRYCRTATVRSACWPPPRASVPGCRWSSAPPAGSPGSPTPAVRTRSRSRPSVSAPSRRRARPTRPVRPARPFRPAPPIGSPRGRWARCSSSSRPRTERCSRSPFTTAACSRWTRRPARSARSPARPRATSPASRSPQIPGGWPGRTPVRSRWPRSGSSSCPGAPRSAKRSRSPRCGSPTPSRRSPPTACTSRSCPSAAWTPPTTPSCST